MTSPCAIAQHQQIQQTSYQSQKRDAGLLSRLFGSLRQGRRAGSSSASSRPGIVPSQIPGTGHQGLQPSGSVACSATAVSQANTPSACSSAPFLNYQTGLESKYTFGREVGKGGNGLVRVVINKETGEEFACKSIRKVLQEASDVKKQGHLDSIRREVQVLTKLKGSLNIVKLEDVYEDEEHVHIIMEMCKGGELWHRIGDRHYSERTVASFMRAVLRTLAQCHAQHILHRDIKPGNFMLLSGDDRAPVKAIDFGLAAPFDPERLPRTDLGLEGTPWYMAPETLRGEWSPSSDMWAAGVMAFQLLCGRFPFDDKKNVYAPAITAIWRSVLNDPLDFNKPWWSGVSEEAQDFCRMLLNRDVAARPTAKDALKHPWLRGNSAERSVGKKLGNSVVARIQRFASGSQLKRTVLQSIAEELLRHPDILASVDRERVVTNDSGRPIVAAPDAACLQPLLKQLHLDQGGAVLDEEALREALQRMGFKLAPCEVSRLMEQVDLEGSGEIDRAAFAASQMDWRHLQRNHTEVWLDLAAKAFRSMDTDGSGVIEVDELLKALRARLPPDEVQTALELALQEAGSGGAGPAGPGGMEASQGIDFEGFVNLLKVSSLDSLDLYDDRMSTRSHGSTHGGSVDRYNNLLAASVRTGDWSRHGVGNSRHGGGGMASDVSNRSNISDVSAVPDTDRSQHPPAQQQQAAAPIVFRFDVDQGDKAAGGKGAIAAAAVGSKNGSTHGVSNLGPAGRPAAGGNPGGMVWRFDVGGGPPAPPQPPPPPVWRFDVAGGVKAAPQQSKDTFASSASAGSDGYSGRTTAAAAVSGIVSGLGRQGGYYDRRMHGSDLYRNVALKALQAGLQRASLAMVAE